MVPLIISGCLRVLQPHWSSYAKRRILYLIQNLTYLKVLRILGLQRIHSIVSCMRLRNYHLIKHINLSMYLDVVGVDC